MMDVEVKSRSQPPNGAGVNDIAAHNVDNKLSQISEQTKAAVAANARHEVNGLQSPPAETALPKLVPQEASSSPRPDAPSLIQETPREQITQERTSHEATAQEEDAPEPVAQIPISQEPLTSEPIKSDHLPSSFAQADSQISLPPISDIAPISSQSGDLPPLPPLPTVEPPVEPTAPEPSIQPPPTSELREGVDLASAAKAGEIMEEKHQRALEADRELSNGLAQSDSAPIPRTLSTQSPPPPPLQAQAPAISEDAMDTSEPATALQPPIPPSVPPPPPEPTQQPADVSMTLDSVDTSQATTLPPPSLPQPPTALTPPSIAPDPDHIMGDAPPHSPNKVTRSREDEEGPDDERATKRTKTDEEGKDVPEFKMPDAPASQALTESVMPSTGEPTSQATGDGASQAATAANVAAAPGTPGVPDKLPAPGPRPEKPDWGQEMTSLQSKALLKGLQSLRKSGYAQPFNQPVDWQFLGLTTYPDIVKHPMDLKTMETKLKANEYKTVAELVADFDQIIANTVLFNNEHHPVSQQGFKMAQAFERHLEKLPSPEEKEPEKKGKKVAAPKPPARRRESRSSAGAVTAVPPPPKTPTAASPSQTQTFAVGPSGVPQIRRDSTVADGRPKREVHPPPRRDVLYEKPRKKKFFWELKFCHEVITEMLRGRYEVFNKYFVQPVDPVALNIPSYRKIIKNPMDLGTIRDKLKASQYENAKEFENDVRLVFNNCYKFNTVNDEVYTAGKKLEELFEEQWGRKKQWISDHAPASGAQSADSSAEASEEEEQEEDEEDEEEEESEVDKKKAREIDYIQEQIRKMQKKVDAMSQSKKKASPPAAPAASKKKKGGASGAKGGKKETKGRGGSKGDKKDAKKAGGKKEKKTPYVTYEQKQDISMRINNLPEKRMNEALDIIRENMPNLGQTDDEIELDIDSVPNEVLYKLLQFVRKYAPSAADPAPEPSRRASGGGSSAAAAAAAGNSRPKKNKPMSKTEQESKIVDIRSKLSQLQAGGGSSSAATAAVDSPCDDDTSGDEDSEESEED